MSYMQGKQKSINLFVKAFHFLRYSFVICIYSINSYSYCFSVFRTFPCYHLSLIDVFAALYVGSLRKLVIPIF